MKKMNEIIKALRLYFVRCSLFCRHNYELINQFEIMSEFDSVVANGKVPNTWNSQKRRIVTDYKCKKCNNIKRLQAVTPR